MIKSLKKTWAEKMTGEKYCPLYTDMILLIFTSKIHDFVLFLVAKMGSNYPVFLVLRNVFLMS